MSDGHLKMISAGLRHLCDKILSGSALNLVLASMHDRLEVQRLNAARVALERRLSQLDASTDRRAGILSPFVPENDRPWRDRIESSALKQAIEEINLKTDPTADVSMQWELEPNEETLTELKQEIVSFLQCKFTVWKRFRIQTRDLH